MSAHTPGPWAEHGVGGCECGMVFGRDGNVLVAIVQGENHLDKINGPDCVPTKAFQQGNARLIAAAPDLLKALKKIAADAGYGVQRRMRAVAREAITKAEGS